MAIDDEAVKVAVACLTKYLSGHKTPVRLSLQSIPRRTMESHECVLVMVAFESQLVITSRCGVWDIFCHTKSKLSWLSQLLLRNKHLSAFSTDTQSSLESLVN
jgi:hypothetical protein